MSIQASGTFCYRLLLEPEIGPTLGNTVYVGLDVSNSVERAPLLFSGLPRRIETVREALDNVRAFDGHLFETRGTTDAKHLHSVMVARKMMHFSPQLVVGDDILQEIIGQK